MAHFAEIDENNKVLRVLVVHDRYEGRGQEYLANDLNFGGTWKQTSYNTRLGVHINGGTPFRKNFARIGFIFSEEEDAFIRPIPEGADASQYTYHADKGAWVLNV